MKIFYAILPILVIVVACTGSKITNNNIPLFNGVDLSGWEGDRNLWRVEDRMIVGEFDEIEHNQFLRTQTQVKDFRLTLDVRIVNGEGNSGIQFRSTALPGGHVRGPQADIGKGYWGKLYEELGRGWLWEQGCDQHADLDGWNRYEVVAVGSRVQTAVNGHLCVDLDDPYIAREGIIALQLHQAFGPSKIQFKNLKLEKNPEFKLKTLK